MKYSELQPNVEYAQIVGNRSQNKIRFTAEDLAKGPSKRYGEQGQITAQVWKMDWDRKWSWKSDSVPLSQIKMTWTEYEAQLVEYNKLRAEQAERQRIAWQKAEEDTKALQEFLKVNREQLEDILGKRNLYTYKPTLQLELNIETLTRLLDRAKAVQA